MTSDEKWGEVEAYYLKKKLVFSRKPNDAVIDCLFKEIEEEKSRLAEPKRKTKGRTTSLYEYEDDAC